MTRLRLPGLALAAIVAACPAHAQLLDSLKGAAGSVGGGGVGGLSMPSVGSASNSNIGGVLQYCIRNKYLGGSDASSVKSGLMGKLGGETKDSQFAAGNRGQLETGQGQSYSLGGGGLKGRVTDKVCGMVLQHAKSLI